MHIYGTTQTIVTRIPEAQTDSTISRQLKTTQIQNNKLKHRPQHCNVVVSSACRDVRLCSAISSLFTFIFHLYLIICKSE